MKIKLIVFLLLNYMCSASIYLQVVNPSFIYGEAVTVNVNSTDSSSWVAYIRIYESSFQSCTTLWQAGDGGENTHYPSPPDDIYMLTSTGYYRPPMPGTQHSVSTIVWSNVTVVLYDYDGNVIDSEELHPLLDNNVTAHAGGPYVLLGGGVVLFDGSQSSATQGVMNGIERYDWKIDNIAVGSGEQLSLTYNQLINTFHLSHGLHNVTLTVQGMVDYGEEVGPGPVEDSDTTTIDIITALQITSPQIGDAWNSGREWTIRWNTLGITANVKVEYSTDSGNHWAVIDQIPNSGSYDWTVPECNSQNCLIRISDTADNRVVKVSELFTIYECTLVSDLNDDCVVDLKDFSILAMNWLSCGDLFSMDCIFELSDMSWKRINDSGFIGEMSKYETTNEQYCQFLNFAKATRDITLNSDNIKVLGTNGSNGGVDFVGQSYYDLAGTGALPPNDDGITNGAAARIQYNATEGKFKVIFGFENHPVTYVSWYGAMAFCNYYGWRLPTRPEWEAVADYTDNRTYPTGMTIDNFKANCSGSNHPYGTTAVGSFGEYGYDLCDMAGNVAEWTSTVRPQGDGIDVRGGVWSSPAADCAISCPNCAVMPEDLFHYMGFRVCRSSEISWVSVNETGGFVGQMSKNEITNYQYCQFLNAAYSAQQLTVYTDNKVYAANDTTHSLPYYNPNGPGSISNPANGGKARIIFNSGTFSVTPGFENHPVTYVSWYGAKAFCDYYGYHLPTQSEWQAVANYTGSWTYACGSTINSNLANYINTYHIYGTTTVGAFGAYGYGLCDMTGNVWEWVLDEEPSLFHKRCGGGWANESDACQTNISDWATQTYCEYETGFRVCE